MVRDVLSAASTTGKCLVLNSGTCAAQGRDCQKTRCQGEEGPAEEAPAEEAHGGAPDGDTKVGSSQPSAVPKIIFARRPRPTTTPASWKFDELKASFQKILALDVVAAVPIGDVCSYLHG